MNIKTPYHNYFFLFGVIYYLIIPVVVLHVGGFEGPGANLIYEHYDAKFNIKYLLIVTGFVIMFYSGSFILLINRKGEKNKREKKSFKKNRYTYTLILLLIFLYLVFKYPSFSVAHRIFDTDPILGFISTVLMLSVFVLLYDIHNGNSIKNRKLFILLLIALVFFLMKSGTRMYFLIPCIMIIVFTREYGLLNIKKTIIIGVLLFALILFVGIYRSGYDINLFLFIFLGEPCFDWLSVGSFLIHNPDLPIIEYPASFISSFIYFIPKFIFPMKSEFLQGISYYVESPLGGMNIFVSLISNFGIIGSFCFLFIMGMFSSYIYKKTEHKFLYIYYIAYCSVIPFQFFRDQFILSNKAVFNTFLLLPALILSLDKIGYKYSNRSSKL